jgi:hypothetical protein
MRCCDPDKSEGESGENREKLEDCAKETPAHPTIRSPSRDVKPSQRALDDMCDASYSEDAQN